MPIRRQKTNGAGSSCASGKNPSNHLSRVKLRAVLFVSILVCSDAAASQTVVDMQNDVSRLVAMMESQQATLEEAEPKAEKWY